VGHVSGGTLWRVTSTDGNYLIIHLGMGFEAIGTPKKPTGRRERTRSGEGSKSWFAKDDEHPAFVVIALSPRPGKQASMSIAFLNVKILAWGWGGLLHGCIVFHRKTGKKKEGAPISTRM